MKMFSSIINSAILFSKLNFDLEDVVNWDFWKFVGTLHVGFKTCCRVPQQVPFRYPNLLDHQVGCNSKKEQQCMVKIDPKCHSKSFLKQNLWETLTLFDVKNSQEFPYKRVLEHLEEF